MSESTLAPSLNLPKAFDKTIDARAYRRFLATVSHSDLDQIVLTFPFQCEDPLLYLPQLNQEQEFSYYWEKPDTAHVIAGGGSLQQITTQGTHRFKEAHQAIEMVKTKTAHFDATAHTDTGFPFLGGFSFFDDHFAPEWNGFPSTSLTLARRFIIKKEGCTTLSIALPLKQNDTVENIHGRLVNELNAVINMVPSNKISFPGRTISSPVLKIPAAERNRWTRSITEARQAIAHNRLEKVVLARRFTIHAPEKIESLRVLNNLRTRYPKCYTFLIQHGSSDAFIGCSPEQLLAYNDRSIYTEALAGSMGRGHNALEDNHLKTELLNSAKNNAEHQFVVQAIEEQLSSLTSTVQRPQRPEIKQLANVQHLYTPMKAHMRNGFPPFLLLNRLHPTPAVGGYPRKEAFDYIRKIESFGRGWFAGPLGWTSTNGEGEFAVAIRSGLIGAQRATLYAGCGIVADSNPAKEWEETNLKFLPMLSALNYE